MSVRKRFENPKIEEVDVDALIEKGAKVKEDRVEESKKWMIINLRLPVEMCESVDRKVQDRAGMSRTGWILEAIQEKLKRSKDESSNP